MIPLTNLRLKRALLLTWAASPLLVGAWGFLIEPNRLVVHRETITPPSWPKDLDGLTVVAISDLHAGAPHIDREKLDDVVELANAQNADVIVLLGDFVISGVAGGTFMNPEPIAEALSKLRAKHGVYAVLGNHDWWWDGERVHRALSNGGIRVLENESHAIEIGGARLYIGGLADEWTRPVQMKKTLSSTRAGDAILMLSHGPDIFPRIPKEVALTLAGHTHGGQVWLPIVGALIVPSEFGARYARGHVVEDGKHLFVTSGVGTSILPVRFLVPPEIAVLKTAVR
jgi:uncharacterized protein